ncbi:MAG: UbiA family prenyltransferase, partial [Myxococcota bacterium]
MTPLLALLRPREWVKNALVLAPLLFGAKLFDLEAVVRALVTGCAFCLAASAGYVWNDLADREADRWHPLKRGRPLASGALGIRSAAALSAGLAFGSLALVAPLGAKLVTCLAGYLGLTVAYSLWLKHVAIVDVLTIGAFYILRVLAGSLAISVPASD